MNFLNTKEDIDFDNISDEELLKQSIKRPDLFTFIIERYEKAFLRKVHGVLRNKEDAEDVVQETFTKVYLNASRFEEQEGAKFSSWAYKILMNTSFTYYQKIKRKRGAIGELTDDMVNFIEDPSSAGILEKKEMSDYISRVLTQMPKVLSRVLHLHFVERRPQKEIAKMERVSVGAVKTRIYRAKKEFQKISHKMS